MTSTRRTVSALSAAVLMAGLLAVTTAKASAGNASTDDTKKLTGCLVKGQGDGGYLLVNAPMEPASTTATQRAAEPGTVGTAGVFANVFYWLKDDDDLRPHVGHRIEVEGEVEGDVKEGEIEIDRKDQWTEIEIESDGREMKAQVPNASIVAGPNADRKIEVLVRRLEVEKVRMLDATCR